MCRLYRIVGVDLVAHHCAEVLPMAPVLRLLAVVAIPLDDWWKVYLVDHLQGQFLIVARGEQN